MRRLVAESHKELGNHDRTTIRDNEPDRQHPQGAVTAESWPATAAGIGRVLRAARLGQGLGLAEVQSQGGMASAEIRALEEGRTDWFSDQITALSSMRRYAWQLGLDGDELTLHLLGSDARPAPSRRPRHEAHEVRTAPPAAGPHAPAAGPRGGQSTVLRATFPHEAGERPAARPTHRPDDTAAIPIYSFQDTAEIPAVGSVTPGYVPAGRRRPSPRRKAPLGFRLTVWTCLIAIFIGAGILAIDHLRPQWLHDLHLLAPSPVSSAKPGTGVHHKATGGKNGGGNGGTLAKVTSSSTTSTWSVPTTSFTVTISASHPCWVAVANSNAAPSTYTFEGVLGPGQVRSFHASGWLSVELGAAGASITVGASGSPAGHQLGLLKPPVAPYTFIFTSSASTG